MPSRTAIVTGASQGIGASIVRAMLDRDFNVVASSRNITRSAEVHASDRIALVDGDVGDPATAARIVETAMARFNAIDVVVNNAGIIINKPFTDYTAGDLKALVVTNIEGFLYVTQLAVRQMLAHKTGGSIVTITASLARHPIRGSMASVPMITKGGLEAATLQLAMEYANEGIRVNAVAPGVVDTPLQRGKSTDAMLTRSPMARVSTADEVAQAVMYLIEAPTVTGQILYVDGGAHIGRW